MASVMNAADRCIYLTDASEWPHTPGIYLTDVSVWPTHPEKGRYSPLRSTILSKGQNDRDAWPSTKKKSPEDSFSESAGRRAELLLEAAVEVAVAVVVVDDVLRPQLQVARVPPQVAEEVLAVEVAEDAHEVRKVLAKPVDLPVASRAPTACVQATD